LTPDNFSGSSATEDTDISGIADGKPVWLEETGIGVLNRFDVKGFLGDESRAGVDGDLIAPTMR
jgi:hypothetical protein